MFHKRIIAWFSIFVICFSLLPAAHAEEYISKNSNLWENLMHAAIKTGQSSGIPLLGGFAQGIGAFLEGDVCRLSEDGYHYSNTLISISETADKYGRHPARAICKYCNEEFWCYASDLQQSYEAQVEELPAPGYNSDGTLLIPFTVTEHCLYTAGSNPSCGGHVDTVYSRSALTANFSCSDNTISCFVKSGYSSFYFSATGYRLHSSLVTPYDGYYSIWIPRIYYTYTSPDGVSVSDGFGGYDTLPSDLGKYYSAGSNLSCTPDFHPGSSEQLFSVVYTCATPLAKFTPAPSVDINFNTTYNINSRPTSITGDYGIIGDNGQIIKVEGDKIVNETNNTYYNPSTGETTTITDWSYNYEDRSYTVTTEAGDTVTITYGDENVTIVEGDTIYNIYYLVNGSGSENPGPGPDVPSACDHTWTETSRTDPTCSTAGKVSSVCSKCNQTKTGAIPATGHSWVIDRTIQTTYDEEGNLLQQGYTIYSCSVCGEQYKDMEGTGPPGAEEEKSIWEKIGDFFGTIGGGFIDIIGAIAGKLLDALIALAEMMMDKLKTVVETVLSIFDEVPALFGGFLDFLGAIFPFLPPEITTILTFGVIAVVFIGILKAVRR